MEVSGKLLIRDKGDSDDVLFLEGHDDPLAEELEVLSGKQVTVRYWITSEQVERDQAAEEFMKQVLGAADVRFEPRYSEITGYLWTDEDLNIGGHDLMNELKSHVGNWLILEADIHTT